MIENRCSLALLVAVASAAALSAQTFAPGVVSAVPNQRQRTPDNNIRTKAECDRKHGTWSEPYRVCVVPYPDAGKLCKNSKGCIGHCLWPLDGKTLEDKPVP